MSTTQFWRPFLTAMLILVSGQFATAQPEKTLDITAAENKQSEVKQTEQPQTAQAEEMVVRFYPGLPKRTADAIVKQIDSLVRADWLSNNGESVVVLGGSFATPATLVVRHQPAIQKHVSHLIDQTRLWHKAAKRRVAGDEETTRFNSIR